MNGYITLTALIVAAIALVAAGIFWLRYRRMEYKKNSSIVQCLLEKDRIERELEHTRIEKRTLEKLLKGRLEETGKSPAPAEGTDELTNTDNI